jgi:hypothetical protein
MLKSGHSKHWYLTATVQSSGNMHGVSEFVQNFAKRNRRYFTGLYRELLQTTRKTMLLCYFSCVSTNKTKMSLRKWRDFDNIPHFFTFYTVFYGRHSRFVSSAVRGIPVTTEFENVSRPRNCHCMSKVRTSTFSSVETERLHHITKCPTVTQIL